MRGGAGTGYEWPESEHGIYVDHDGNIWIGGNYCAERNRSGSIPCPTTSSSSSAEDGEFLIYIGRKEYAGSGDKRICVRSGIRLSIPRPTRSSSRTGTGTSAPAHGRLRCGDGGISTGCGARWETGPSTPTSTHRAWTRPFREETGTHPSSTPCTRSRSPASRTLRGVRQRARPLDRGVRLRRKDHRGDLRHRADQHHRMQHAQGPEHFHATVVSGTAMAVTGVACQMVPLIFRRETAICPLAPLQP